MGSWFDSDMTDGGWIVMGAGLIAVLALLSMIFVLMIRARPR